MGIVNGLIPTQNNTPASAKSIFDDRLVEVDVIFKNKTITFSQLAIFARGNKRLCGLQNDCEIRVYNLSRALQQEILTKSSPYIGNPRELVTVALRVGRKSYGEFLLFAGNVIVTDITQPPDIGIVLRGLTGNFYSGNIINYSLPPTALLSTTAQYVASLFNPPLTLKLQITNDVQVSNFSGTGTPLDAVNDLNQIGGISASIEDKTLLVIDSSSGINADPILVNEATGMVGIPQVTSLGVNVKIMVNNLIGIGTKILVISKLNPAADGIFIVRQIHFEIANRDQAFWYHMECSAPAYYGGSNG